MRFHRSDILKGLAVIPYAAVPVLEDYSSTLILADDPYYSERLQYLSEFIERQKDGEIKVYNKNNALKKFNSSLDLIKNGDVKDIEVEYTRDNTIFITSIFMDGKELHLELFFGDGNPKSFYALYDKDKMISTGSYHQEELNKKVREKIIVPIELI